MESFSCHLGGRAGGKSGSALWSCMADTTDFQVANVILNISSALIDVDGRQAADVVTVGTEIKERLTKNK